MKRISVLVCAAAIIGVMAISQAAVAAELKVGYVDLRKAFFEYEKATKMDGELNAFAESSQAKRDTMVQNITKLRDEIEILSDESKQKKQQEMDAAIRELQDFDRESRQTILEKKDNLFREVMDDIQKVVVEQGKKDGYDYILDSRNIMYADEKYDLTPGVVAELNK